MAASRLMKQGRTPTMDEVAEEALVSRATAYRHFPKIEALLVEAPLDAAITDPSELFAKDSSDDVEERIDRAEASLHEMVYQNEAQLRIMLANSIRRDLTDDSIPARQNRRLPLIEAALAPARHRLPEADYERLCAALALIFGTESMIVFRDVLGIDSDTARTVKSWAVRALVHAALRDSTSTAVE
ncbi:MAG: helix-turn-helix domain containing protein [Candidatus Contendobacter sp.]|nr:helix-turn-helix domain containing protein [Candidatus Contendobacter sp.]